ncbi:MAG TPA: ATP-binding protein [Solirubrobacteraceae bacterium]|nr:ATP-binding protein [Solirubrobacteraceae bacterium]
MIGTEAPSRWGTVIRACSEAVAVIDSEGVVQLLSPSMERELGNVVGTDLVELLHPRDVADFHGMVISFVAGLGITAWSDWRLRGADGSWVDMETTATNMIDVPGLRGIMLTSRNVTARNATFRALQEARRRLEAVLDIAGAAIWVTDLDGTIMLANRSCSALLGVPHDELAGRRATDLLTAEEAERLESHGREVLRAGHALQFDELISIGGETRHFLSTTTPIIDAEGNATGLCSVAADITDRRRAREERDELEAALQRSQRMESLGQLAGGVAHDFNNLLAVILNYAEFVGEQLEPGHVASEDLVEIVHATERAADLTSQLLVFCRHDHERPEPVDVNRVALDTQRLLDRTLGEDVELTVTCAPRDVMVLANRGQLEQVLMNLVLNARDAMPSGGRVSVTIAEHGSSVRIDVADEGEGMSPETAERAFDPFFTTKPKGRGTGLGLATVYGIVTGAGGQIEIDSRIQEGTTITMHLPISDHDRPAAEAAPEALEAANGTTIMVVEDEDAIRTLTRRILSRQGYDVVEAMDPADAIARCAEARPDLLLTDVVMPGMSGKALSERLRETHPDLRVLFMSGYTDNVMDRYGLDAAGDTLLQKPFNGQQLLAAVHEALADD